jgi:hypothetical protein
MEKKLVAFKPNFLPKVHLISEEFEIPQLNKKGEFGLCFHMIMKLLKSIIQ